MGYEMTTASTAEQLRTGVASGTAELRVVGEITEVPPLRLAPGQRLVAAEPGAAIHFAAGGDGLLLTQDNTVTGLRLTVEPTRRAIANDTSTNDFGTLRLTGLTVLGQVQLLARDRVRAGHVSIDQLDIVAADTRERKERPALLGVGVVQGAFTLWNMQNDPGVTITANVRGISTGRDGAPVRGSGVFVAGAGPGTDAGRVDLDELITGPVYTDGGIAEGSHDTITGGVFVIYGAHIARVVNHGPVTTYGVNDMMLDNWGEVDEWTAQAPLTSYGRSGVGVVNFGSIGTLRIAAPIETYGIGGRGFNVYRLDGFTGPTVGAAEFDRIVTHADAAIGIQVGQPIGSLTVHRGIETFGGAGDSLVRGVIMTLSAHALSVQPGGRVEQLDVRGGLRGAGAGVTTVDIRGEVADARVAGGIVATGPGSDALHVASGTLRLNDTEITAADGVAVRVAKGAKGDLRDVRASGASGDLVQEADD
jgi:hypothetical protein